MPAWLVPVRLRCIPNALSEQRNATQPPGGIHPGELRNSDSEPSSPHACARRTTKARTTLQRDDNGDTSAELAPDVHGGEDRPLSAPYRPSAPQVVTPELGFLCPAPVLSCAAMNDAERWNEKYRSGRADDARACELFVLETLDALGPGEGRLAPDLASGAGRHALELARRGWDVHAWDVSDVGLELLSERASAEGLPVQTRVVDLNSTLPIDGPAFDLILWVNYLQRDLLPRVSQLLAPGGRLLFNTFTTDHTGEHPSPRHCLHPGELAHGIPGLETDRHVEREGRAGIVSLQPLEERRPK